jgi:hypothetical protein
MVRALAEDMSEHCYPARRLILLVDALDEAAQPQELEERLLEQFLYRVSVRILAAMRDDQRLHRAALRGSETPINLLPLPKQEAIQQLQRRARDLSTPPPADLLKLVWPYRGQTAGINSFLSLRARANRAAGRNPWLSADDRDCRRAVIGPRLTDRLDEFLWKLAGLDDETWTEEAFAQECGLALSAAGDFVQKFFRLGVVTRPKKVPHRRQIVDGLRELIEAERQLRGFKASSWVDREVAP